MAAPLGNHYWRLRESHGRNLEYATADELAAEIIAYFQWADANPWYKNEQLKTPIRKKNKETGEESVTTVTQIPTARPYSISGLCVHLGIDFKTWKEYGKREGFVHICTRTEEIIETQQLEGAAVGAFNANIIARKLGLSESNILKGDKDNPVQVETKFDITLNLNK
jgi:hypothetical protein